MEAQDINCQPKKYTCSHDKCGYQTNKLFNFQRHRKIHEKKAQLREMAAQAAANGHLRDQSPAPKMQRLEVFQIECAQAGCPFTCDQLDDYIDHVQSVHEKDLQFVQKQFEDKESLEAFMRSLQERTACSLAMSRTFEADVGESFELCCATSGRIRHGHDGRLEPSADRSGIYCTFYLHVTLVDGIIKVRGCETHFGHTVDINMHHASQLAANNNNNNDSMVSNESMHGIETVHNTPTPPTPTMPMNVVQPTPQIQQASPQLPVAEKLDQHRVEISLSPTDSDSFQSNSQNISPMREDVEKMDVKEERIPNVPEPKSDYQSEVRRLALDFQSETELFLESDSYLTTPEFQQLEKATLTIIDLLRRARTRPAVAIQAHDPPQHHTSQQVFTSPTTETLNTPVSSFVSPTARNLSTALLNNPHQLHQLQQALRETQLAAAVQQTVHQQQRQMLHPNNMSAATTTGSILHASSISNTLPQLTNAALLLSAAAAQRQQAVLNQQFANSGQLQNTVAANVLSSLANSIQQNGSVNHNALMHAQHHNQQTAVVQPQPQQSQNLAHLAPNINMLSGQNSRFEELVKKAIIELDAQRRSTCAQCHRKEPAYSQNTSAWVECQRCSLKFHTQCVPDAQCVKCKAPFA